MSVVVTWADEPADTWFFDIPVDSGVVVTYTGAVQRLSERWFYDELNTFCHDCRRGVGVRVIPSAEAYMRQLMSTWDQAIEGPEHPDPSE